MHEAHHGKNLQERRAKRLQVLLDKRRVEKQTSTGASGRPNDARQAFDNLFKD
jgi:hypothetical protein